MRKRVFRLLIYSVALGLTQNATAFQKPTPQSLEAKKKQLHEARTALADNQAKRVELEAQLQTLLKQIQEGETLSTRLSDEITIEAEEVAFIQSPPRTVLDVSDATSFLIDFGGSKRFVMLHGVIVDASKDASVTKALRKRFIKKPVFVRCADSGCASAYLYIAQDGESLNTQMVKSDLAIALPGGRFDLAPFSLRSNPSPFSNAGAGQVQSNPNSSPAPSAATIDVVTARQRCSCKRIHKKGRYLRSAPYPERSGNQEAQALT